MTSEFLCSSAAVAPHRNTCQSFYALRYCGDRLFLAVWSLNGLQDVILPFVLTFLLLRTLTCHGWQHFGCNMCATESYFFSSVAGNLNSIGCCLIGCMLFFFIIAFLLDQLLKKKKSVTIFTALANFDSTKNVNEWNVFHSLVSINKLFF